MMTTNRIETLDSALLRPGRIDYKLYLGKASDAQKIELYQRFFSEASYQEAREFVRRCGSAETMAEFQGLLLSLVDLPAKQKRARAGSTIADEQAETVLV